MLSHIANKAGSAELARRMAVGRVWFGIGDRLQMLQVRDEIALLLAGKGAIPTAAADVTAARR